MTAPDAPTRTLRDHLGFLACRVLVPLWVATGAMFKLVGDDPGLLPRQLLRHAHRAGVDLEHLLAALVSIEFALVCAMVLVWRLSRLAAGSLLLVFCAVLVNELAHGASSCGCLGRFSPSPWLMLGIDTTLLVLVAVGRVRPLACERGRAWPLVVAIVLAVALTALTIWRIVPHVPVVIEGAFVAPIPEPLA